MASRGPADVSRARMQSLLQELGLRVTPQRLLILEALHSREGHVTAEDIHETIVDSYPGLNIATVYRNLEALVAAGIVTETRFGAKCAHYELSPDSRHHHLICERCGRVDELDDSLLEPLRESLVRTRGFVARFDHLAVFGVCHECDSGAVEKMERAHGSTRPT